jgi:UDP-N-acetylmuramoylalanine--D-glutamate ligase
LTEQVLSPGLDLAGKRVLVLGLGVTGVAVAEVLASRGAAVFASDSGEVSPSDIEALASSGIEVESEGHTKARAQLAEFDFVVPSPGISPVRGFLAEVVASGAHVVPELELGVRLSDAPVVAVTGTNGKTTVCRLIEHMARQAGLRAFACGNLETKFVTAAMDNPDADLFVVEAPSFALTFCETFAPKVAIVTSLAPDHLDWHGTFEHYRDSKARIAAHQTPDDLFLYPAAQPELASFAPEHGPHRMAFSAANADEPALGGFRKRGTHFADDAVAAMYAAQFCGVNDEAISEALKTFTFDKHRLERIGSKGDVDVYDDSVSANPLATLAALRTFEKPVVLIAGGRNKGNDLGVLADEAARVRSVVAIGEAAEELTSVFTGAGKSVSIASSMDEAVAMALEAASPGDSVLLSPSCASWDMFQGYADRGRAFREACVRLGVTA